MGFKKPKIVETENYAVLLITRRNGDKYPVLIDLDDVEKVSMHSWSVDVKETGHIYVQATPKDENGRYVKTYLHRYLLNPPKDMQVDHINHNTLDNRKSNMRIVTNGENCQNLLGAKSHNKSSTVLGVSYYKTRDKYTVQFKVNGKWHFFGYYKDKDEAEMTAIIERARLMPFSPDARILFPEPFTLDDEQ